MSGTQAEAGERDRLIDLLRAGATTTVVLWHWVFTIIVWKQDGPHADNPIGYVSGLWCITWVLQVMPLFFVAGGYTHSLAWVRYREAPGAWRRWLAKRCGQLLVPASVLIAVVAGAGLLIGRLHEGPEPWLSRSVILVLSPLWFLGVYLVLVVSVPVWDWLHRRYDVLVPLGLAALAMGVDVLRFHFRFEAIALANLVFVWAACHQVGWSWPRLRDAPARFGHVLILIGGAALVGLTNMGLYPRSMVGTTSAIDRFSNMGPPTLPIIGLCVFQLGLVITFRERIVEWSCLPRVERFVAWLSRNAMPIFLWHSVGFALFFGVMRTVWTVPGSPSLLWWVTRPLWVAGPLICTLPLLGASARGLRGASAVTGALGRTARAPLAHLR